MNRLKKIRLIVVIFPVVVLCLACGSGYEVTSGDDDEAEEVDATLTGFVFYDGEQIGEELVIGLMDHWPMVGPPVEFMRIAVPTQGYPFAYEIGIHHVGEYHLAAYLDVDPLDGVMMNREIDPMDLPDGAKVNMVEGENEYDFILQDPEDLGYGPQEE